MNNRETPGSITRYWRSAARARAAPAPARDRPVPLAHGPGRRPARTFFSPRRRRQRVYACLLIAPPVTPPEPAETTKAPGSPGPLLIGRNRRLLQRGVDRGELGVQVGAEAVDHCDDRERNAGGNQAVFDGGGAGLVLHETRNQVLHR